MFLFILKKKYKKLHRFSIKKKKIENNFFCSKFTDFSLKMKENIFLTPKHVETIRRSLKRIFKKNIFLKINVFPYLSSTKKPISARMGKGKGKPDKSLIFVKKGKILVEFRLLRNLMHKDLITKLCSKTLNSKISNKIKINKLIY